ncbi:MAG: hypothetical protein COV52_01485 [Gammaproteobacteria bacterium CG11_big_fil_rev_8_21_14_0_20_46_22]|nr:MAG: hypothetical protein COW05_03210 [Gammaproteobacteria bacterium CG12_big_fil_rev_8_21_14_0_65_46_12]PIR11927.1 MAG: hypothetical protein COV52_01485 [Gammaproteobacteria bacterium CG11_big_fil_rev_8_21_14_0_20_46_22]
MALIFLTSKDPLYEKYVWLTLSALPAFLLSGCVSYHVANYQSDHASAKAFQSKVKDQVGVAAFTMKADQNSNAVMCRAAGKVYLPNKQTYTQYIQSAFVSQLKA